MLTSEVALRIARPSRYLAQMCRHAAAMGEMGGGGHRPHAHAATTALARGDLRVQAEHSGTHGVVTFDPWGRAILDATDDTLTVRVEAADEDALQQIQDIVTKDLERFGRRRRISVTWPPPAAPGGDLAPAKPPPGSGLPPRRGRRSVIVLTPLIAAAVAVHLGLGGAFLAGWHWTGLTIEIVVLMVAAKILLVTLGRRVLRRTHIPHRGALRHLRAGGHRPG
ncbi:DUF2218 domain-containing protein [Actinomadura formosensis]|uniref:DUF2218 domain-containing protein n=1 Tax=Actinomadura formosensis TaxID=60706 RepID=UPI003D9443E9